jgi:8-oxo-dGTP diphosphatase
VDARERGEAAHVAEAVRSTSLVRAAGGVVWRSAPSGEAELLVVHRPKYDDWTFPKGKNEPDEDDIACALREVEEETGFRCTLGPELAATQYVDRKGRPKEVRYWVMTVEDGAFTPTEEVDELRWVSPQQARWLLSYDRDRDVLETFLTGSNAPGRG